MDNNNLTIAQRLALKQKQNTHVLEVQISNPDQAKETLETLKLIAQNCTPEQIAMLKKLVSDPNKIAKAMSYSNWLI